MSLASVCRSKLKLQKQYQIVNQNIDDLASFTAAGSDKVEMKDQTEAKNTDQHQGVLTIVQNL